MAANSYIKRDPGYRSLWKRGTPLLPSLDIEFTERCNNDCIHCCINLPADDKKTRSRELTTHQWKDILSQAAECGTLTVRFSGGEPLLRKDFPEIYLFARHLGMKVIIFTNGRLITRDTANMLARIPPLEKIEITVFGMKARSYEAVTGVPGSYEKFRRGVNLLLEQKVPFIVKGVILPGNKDEIEEFETWAATLPWTDRPPSYSFLFDLRGRRDSDEKNRRIARLRLSPEKVLSIEARDKEKYRKEMRLFCSRFMGPQGDRLFTCGAGRSLCVDAYGKLQPCMLLRHPHLAYDLKTGTLRDAMEKKFPALRKIRAKNPRYLERCARCLLKGLCDQCPARSWSEHGTLDTPVEYLCQVAHARARLLGLISPGEKGWEVENIEDRIRGCKIGWIE